MSQENTASVLIVEDDPDWGERFMEICKAAGAQAVLAESVAAATEILSNSTTSFAAVIIDGLNGGWREIVELAHIHSIPQIVVASADNQVVYQAKNRGILTVDKGEPVAVNGIVRLAFGQSTVS